MKKQSRRAGKPKAPALSTRGEDILEDVMAKLAKRRGSKPRRALDLNALMQLIMLILASLPKKPEPAPTPQPGPTPTPPPGPTPTPAPTPPTPPAVARIDGGKAAITGLTEGGPIGPRVGGTRLQQILGGSANAPHDSRFEFDCTPSAGGKKFGHDDPRWEGQPPSLDAPEPMRLHFTYEGAGSADLAHEYANYGCTPRIRVKTGGGAGGTLSDIYFLGPDYGDGEPVRIEVTPGPIHVGRGA
jgi:hypothetical protein